jgi:SAM-dependent methyltransferase
MRQAKRLGISAAGLLSLALAASLYLRGWQGEHPVTGRQIAPVMGFGGAAWLDRPEREQEEAPEQAVDALELRRGMQVADVGAGTGYFTLRLARRVSPGKVWANDIQPRMLEVLRQRAARERIENIEAVLGTDDDPKLPPRQLDLILMVDVYHELSKPRDMLRKLAGALNSEGRLVLLEYRKEDPRIPIRFEHKMSVDEVRAELESDGFRFDKLVSTLPRQHLLVFRPARAGAAAAGGR